MTGQTVDEIGLIERPGVAAKFCEYRCARNFRGVLATERMDDEPLLAEDCIVVAAALGGVEGAISAA